MKKLQGENTLILALPFLASAVLLTVIQPPISWSVLAWVALVPFILGCSPKTNPKQLALVAYVVSLCYWLGNLYWVFPVTVLGWLAFCAYTALLWPIVALCLRYCRGKKMPLSLAAGVLFVGAEYLQGFPLGGFFWRFLAHSQYRNITLIQTADIFGTAGLSFLIAMVNGLVAELIIAGRPRHDKQDARTADAKTAICWPNILKRGNMVQVVLVCAAVAAAIAYGRWRINQSDKFVEPGPLVAALQSNVPQSVKRTFQAGQQIFDTLLEHSRASTQAGAELIVWPETMVQAMLDTDVWPFLVSSEEDKALDKALREHAKGAAYVLVGAYGAKIQLDSSANLSLLRYNSAFLYRPDGSQFNRRYDKIHLVLFGEYLPFRNSCHWLYNLLMRFTPYNYDYSLERGTEYTVFEMTTPTADKNMTSAQHQKPATETSTYRFGVIICYEDTIPAIARNSALDDQGHKRIDWLLNISNDGWFVRFNDNPQRVIASTELAQHAAVCAFRAVENRLAVVRSVNTGISCLIDSLGRIHDGYVASSPGFPANAMDRKGIAGWFIDKMPIDKRTTFFSKHGQWLDYCCTGCLVLLIIVPVSSRFLKTGRTTRLSG